MPAYGKSASIRSTFVASVTLANMNSSHLIGMINIVFNDKEVNAMRISIFGLGYVGAVCAGCLSARGHEVVGVDISKEKIDLINAGKSPIVEPGLG